MHCILRDFSWSPKRASIDGRRIPSGNVLVGADWHGLCGKDSGWMPVGMEKMRQSYFARDTGCFPSDLRPWLAIMNQNRWVCPTVSKAAKAGTTASRCAGHLATNNGCCGSELHKPGSRGKVTVSWRALGAHHLHPRFDLWKDTRSRPMRWVCRTSGGPGVVSRCRLCVPLCTAAFRLRPQGLVTRLERCLDFFHVPDVLCWSSTFPDVWVKVGVPGPHLESSRGSALGNWKKEQQFWGKSGFCQSFAVFVFNGFLAGKDSFCSIWRAGLIFYFLEEECLNLYFFKGSENIPLQFRCFGSCQSLIFFSLITICKEWSKDFSKVSQNIRWYLPHMSRTHKNLYPANMFQKGGLTTGDFWICEFGPYGWRRLGSTVLGRNCGHDQCPRTPHCVENFDVSLRGWLQL